MKYLKQYKLFEGFVYPEKYKNYIRDGNIENIKELLKQGWDPSVDRNDPFFIACQYGQIEIVKLLLQDKRVNPASHDNSAIAEACREGNIEVINLLLKDSRVDPSGNSNYGIKRASRNGHVEVVKLLLKDSRVDPTAEDNFAIRTAFDNKHWKIVELLLLDGRILYSDDQLYRKYKQEIRRMYREGELKV